MRQIEGVLRHCTDVDIDRQNTDTHGASIVRFAFAHMLGFNVLPRLKNVGTARPYRPAAGEDDTWPHLAPVLSTKTIDFELIRQQYDQVVKYTTALRLGTAETMASKVVENWNSANHDVFYGNDGDLTGSDKESQEVSMLALHLLQSALVHVNTLLLQDILSEEKWQKRLTDADRRALSPLFWTHVNPYGRFGLDMNSHLDLAAAAMVPGSRPALDTRTPEPAAEGTAGSAS
ncbi:Tn3 family transposase [Streptomyces sp. NPDC055036]